MMRIATSPDFLESIANEPEVFKSVAEAGGEPVDLHDGWERCIALEWDDGGFLFAPDESNPGVFEVHTLFRRGATQTVEKCQQAMAHMFSPAVGAHVIVTLIPRDLRHVRLYAYRNGFKLLEQGSAQMLRESGPVPLDLYALRRTDFYGGESCLLQ